MVGRFGGIPNFLRFPLVKNFPDWKTFWPVFTRLRNSGKTGQRVLQSGKLFHQWKADNVWYTVALRNSVLKCRQWLYKPGCMSSLAIELCMELLNASWRISRFVALSHCECPFQYTGTPICLNLLHTKRITPNWILLTELESTNCGVWCLLLTPYAVSNLTRSFCVFVNHVMDVVCILLRQNSNQFELFCKLRVENVHK